MNPSRTGKATSVSPDGPPDTPPDAPSDTSTGDLGADLPLPHERDASIGNIAAEPDPQIEQAKKDLDEGQVDTDMWGTPGLDHARKQRIVPNTKPKE